MTIKGLGNDLIEIQRIKEAATKAFLDRLFTKKEQAYCEQHKDPYPRYAGRFAAKEAIVKALGCGFGKDVLWHDIEILPDDMGKPIVHLSGNLKKKFDTPHILVTISHSKELASAVAIWAEG